MKTPLYLVYFHMTRYHKERKRLESTHLGPLFVPNHTFISNYRHEFVHCEHLSIRLRFRQRVRLLPLVSIIFHDIPTLKHNNLRTGISNGPCLISMHTLLLLNVET